MNRSSSNSDGLLCQQEAMGHVGPFVCKTLQHTATHCNTLQHTATYCNILQHTATYCNILQHTATHCNTLQHTAAHCSTLQHTATQCNATHCNTLQHTTLRRKSLHHTALHYNTLHFPAAHMTCGAFRLHRTAPYCTILQHTAPYCNTLQHNCNTTVTHMMCRAFSLEHVLGTTTMNWILCRATVTPVPVLADGDWLSRYCTLLFHFAIFK